MEIVMKKKKTFCPRKEHLAMIAAAVGIGMALAFWCLVWPVTGARAGPLAALVVGTAVAYALIGLGMVFLIARGLTVIPGKPARLTVTVNTSLRYICTGSALAISPKPKAAEGVAGVRIASIPAAKTCSKSRLISALTLRARL